MKTLEERLNRLRATAEKQKIKIMILGLGSVGNYLLDYLMSCGDENLEICVAGRNAEKMVSDVNIVRVASLIRGQNRSAVKVMDGVDFNDVGALAACLESYASDGIVNASRSY